MDQARLVARQLGEYGKPVSQRALRSGGVKGPNETLNAQIYGATASNEFSQRSLTERRWRHCREDTD